MAKPDRDRVRPFSDLLRDLDRGRSHEELSEAVQTLVLAVKDTGKRGSISYTLKVEPMKGDHAALVATDTIKINLPEHDRRSSLFFADGEGNLTREDPAQEAFNFLRDASGLVTGAEDVDPKTGEIKTKVAPA